MGPAQHAVKVTSLAGQPNAFGFVFYVENSRFVSHDSYAGYLSE
jgi:hypothetical protein